MKDEKLLDRLIEMLCAERGEPVPPLREAQKPDYFRALCNVRPPLPPSPGFLSLQDEYLSGRAKARGAEDVNKLDYRDNIALYRGDITRLNADAIVDACNSALLGCFHPLHGCIDNAIHSAAGIQVRLGCNEMMRGKEEPNGKVRVTKGYNLPCKYIFHTVGPVVYGGVSAQNRKDLESCYLSCLDEAKRRGLSSIAFCCISTGEYRYPKREACALAVGTVRRWLKEKGADIKVIFDVFSEEDERIYERELFAEDK